MLAAAPILCALLATLQVPTGILGDGYAGSRVRGVDLVLGAASGPDAQPTPESHWPSPFTYGEAASGPSNQYNGRVFDPGTGFHDYGARMYWPQIGRFISADSNFGDIGSPASLNRYSYVLNNPYRYVDPSGRDAQAALDFLAGAGRGLIEGFTAPAPPYEMGSADYAQGRELTMKLASGIEVVAGLVLDVGGLITGPGEVVVASVGTAVAAKGAATYMMASSIKPGSGGGDLHPGSESA